jgi:hypothetical protein
MHALTPHIAGANNQSQVIESQGSDYAPERTPK